MLLGRVKREWESRVVGWKERGEEEGLEWARGWAGVVGW
jgi:hypothetical protein